MSCLCSLSKGVALCKPQASQSRGGIQTLFTNNVLELTHLKGSGAPSANPLKCTPGRTNIASDLT